MVGIFNDVRKTDYLLPKALDKRLVTISWVTEIYGKNLDYYRGKITENKCVLSDFFTLSDEHQLIGGGYDFEQHQKLVAEQVSKAKLKWSETEELPIKRVILQDTYVGYDGGKEWGIFFEYERDESDSEVIRRIQKEIKADIQLMQDKLKNTLTQHPTQ